MNIAQLSGDGPFADTTALASPPPDETLAADGHFELVMVPHQGRVILCDRLDGRQSLAHQLTHEHLLLPTGGRQSLLFDEEGFAFLIADGSDHHQVVEDIFKKTLYERDDGMLFVREGVEPNDRIWSLTDRLRQYKSAKVRWPYGVNHLSELPVFALLLHRHGFACCWSLMAIYKLVGLTCYKQQPSKWVYESQKPWVQHFESLGFEGAFVKSAQGDGPDDGALSSSRFLPSPSVTTPGFLAIMVRFLHHSPQRGGLRQALQGHVRSLLQGLFSSLAAKVPEGSWQLPLHISHSWVYQWPKSEREAPQVILQVDRAGKVDLQPLLIAGGALPRRSPRLLRKWADLVSECGSVCELGDLFTAVSIAPSSANAMPFLAQLIAATASCIEKALGEMSRQESVADGGLIFKVDSAADMIRTDKDIDVTLHRHLLSARSLIADAQHVSFTCDKAWIKGLNLMNGILVTPENVAALCPPQVAIPGGKHIGRLAQGGPSVVGRENPALSMVYMALLGV